MKKITFLLTVLLSTSGLFAQGSVEQLLDRLDQLKHTPLSFTMVLEQHFTTQEQQVLQNYFDTQTVSYPTASSFAADSFLALDIRNGGIFGTLDGTPPFDSFNEIATNGLNAFADDLTANGVLYALSFDPNTSESNLVSVDQVTGSFSVVDNLAGLLTGHTPSGLSYNFADDVMYALSSDGSLTQLYSVNLITATLTPIGAGTGNALGIWLEIDNDGNAWMADITNDTFYNVNLSTGVGTAVGPLDIDINFAQDVSYDHVNDELIMAAYTGGGTGGIYEVNRSTGLAVFIGQTDALNAEFGMFSVLDNPLSVEDNFAQLVKVYPNPMNAVINIEVPDTIDIIGIFIYDVLGRTTNTNYVDGQVDVSSLPSGVYLLQLRTSEGTVTRKLVKQ